MFNRYSRVAVGFMLLTLAGCTTSNKTTTPADTDASATAAATPTPVTAKAAFGEMYTNAWRNWTKDFVLLHLTNKDMPGFKSENGTAPVWEAILASPSRKEYRVYKYAIAAAPPDIYKGVVVGNVMPWNGPTRDAMPVSKSEFNADSDVAYRAAAADAAAWLKQHPQTKLSDFELGNSYKLPAPVWRLMWGDKKLGYVAYVDASTGKVVKSNDRTLTASQH